MEESIFTKIINGEVPSYKIYEDDKTIAFLDIHPVQDGMVLVVPKTQAENFMDLSNEDYIAFWQTVKKVGQRLRQKFPSKKKIAIQVEGLDVAHVHAKLFPFDTAEEFRAIPNEEAVTDYSSLAELAAKLSI